MLANGLNAARSCAEADSAVGYLGLPVTLDMMAIKPRRLPRIPKSRRIAVTRSELDRVIDLLNERGEVVDQMRRELDVQFKRIAQLQEEMDRLKRER
jgi:hypothetical protein